MLKRLSFPAKAGNLSVTKWMLPTNKTTSVKGDSPLSRLCHNSRNGIQHCHSPRRRGISQLRCAHNTQKSNIVLRRFPAVAGNDSAKAIVTQSPSRGMTTRNNCCTSSEKSLPPRCGAGNDGLMRLYSLQLSFIILYCLVSVIQAGKTADVLVLADPGTYSILNRYEQPLTEKEEASFTAYVPLQVQKQDGMLGDDITPAMHCLFNGATYYLLSGGSCY